MIFGINLDSGGMTRWGKTHYGQSRDAVMRVVRDNGSEDCSSYEKKRSIHFNFWYGASNF